MAGAEEFLEKKETQEKDRAGGKEESCICAEWGGIFFSFSLRFTLSYFGPKLIMTVEHKAGV